MKIINKIDGYQPKKNENKKFKTPDAESNVQQTKKVGSLTYTVELKGYEKFKNQLMEIYQLIAEIKQSFNELSLEIEKEVEDEKAE